MTQYNLTQILKVIRNFVMRNRPCYRDYLGSETTTKTVQIGAGTFEDNGGRVMTQFQVTDPAFTGFVLGKTYAVTIDGITEDYVARNLSPVSEEMGPIIGTITTYNIDDDTFDGWICLGGVSQSGEAFGVAQTLDTSFAGKTISISQTRTETVKHYNTKLLPEYLLPAFLRKNVVASKTEVQSAQSAADNAKAAADNAQNTAQAALNTAGAARSSASEAYAMANKAQAAANTAKSTADEAKTKAINAYTKASIAETTAQNAQTAASAKFQLMQQTTVKTTATIGTINYNADSVSVKGLNIAVGSTIKVTAADGAFSGTGIWNAPYRNIDIYNNATGRKLGQLSLELLQDGDTYKFTNRVAGTTLSNLVIEYEKVEIPKTIGTARFSGAWLPPYLIANCLYLTKDSADSGLATLYRITIDDTGTLKATEVTE